MFPGIRYRISPEFLETKSSETQNEIASEIRHGMCRGIRKEFFLEFWTKFGLKILNQIPSGSHRNFSETRNGISHFVIFSSK